MSSAGKYADAAGRRRWRARWTGPDGRPKEKRGYDRKSDAEAYAADREAEARHGVTLEGERPSGRTTVRDWGRTWVAGLDLAPHSKASYEHALRRIEAGLGTRALSSLRPSELRAWRQGLTRVDGKPLAASTANHTAAVLAMLLRAAVHDGLLDRTPMQPQRGGRARDGRVVDPAELLTLAQVRAWGAALPLHAADMPVVAASLGLRQGELLGLRLPQIDWLRRQVRVVEQLQSPIGAGQPGWRPPKTAAGVRTLPLPDVAAEALAHHLERQPPVDGEPIFRGARGQRWRRGTFQEAWTRGRVAAGLPAWAHWHALRDVYASSLIRAGVDLRTVMTLLGHTSSEETLRTYARLWPDAQDHARQALEGLWRDTSPASSGQVVGTED